MVEQSLCLPQRASTQTGQISELFFFSLSHVCLPVWAAWQSGVESKQAGWMPAIVCVMFWQTTTRARARAMCAQEPCRLLQRASPLWQRFDTKPGCAVRLAAALALSYQVSYLLRTYPGRVSVHTSIGTSCLPPTDLPGRPTGNMRKSQAHCLNLAPYRPYPADSHFFFSPLAPCPDRQRFRASRGLPEAPWKGRLFISSKPGKAWKQLTS